MNKAFTREPDSGAEEISAFRPQLPPGTRDFITRVGADGLRQRPTERLEEKRALGARSIEASATVEADLRKLESARRSLVISSPCWTIAVIIQWKCKSVSTRSRTGSKASSGVERAPLSFVTAFVTSRRKSSSRPEWRRNAGRGIKPA